MICDECGIHPATIRLMSIVNGEKTARNLCTRCMADVKKQLPHLDLANLDGMLASLLAATKQVDSPREPAIDLTCSSCGTTYGTFQKKGMLGCAECYHAFRIPLEELLKRIHGHTQHQGHVPGMLSNAVSSKLTILSLKEQLAIAIADEEYEQAAMLRDQIRSLSETEPSSMGGTRS